MAVMRVEQRRPAFGRQAARACALMLLAVAALATVAMILLPTLSPDGNRAAHAPGNFSATRSADYGRDDSSRPSQVLAVVVDPRTGHEALSPRQVDASSLKPLDSAIAAEALKDETLLHQGAEQEGW